MILITEFTLMSTKNIVQSQSASGVSFSSLHAPNNNFRAEKTITDLTGNTSKDTYWAGLQFHHLASTFALVNVDIDDIYDCLQMAKPVTILPGEGIDLTCDYAKCVGEEVKVGY